MDIPIYLLISLIKSFLLFLYKALGLYDSLPSKYVGSYIPKLILWLRWNLLISPYFTDKIFPVVPARGVRSVWSPALCSRDFITPGDLGCVTCMFPRLWFVCHAIFRVYRVIKKLPFPPERKPLCCIFWDFPISWMWQISWMCRPLPSKMAILPILSLKNWIIHLFIIFLSFIWIFQVFREQKNVDNF